MTDDSNCGQTPHVMADYLGSRAGSTARREADRHIAACPDCQAELAQLEPVAAGLQQWREQPVPAWNRRPQGSAPSWQSRWLRWQWAPLAAAMVLVLAVLFNVQVGVNEAGWQVSFGSSPGPAATDDRVRRPDGDSLRQSMALSVEAAESLSPREQAEDAQFAPWRDSVAAFERQLYDLMCRHGAGIRETGDQSLTLVLSGMGRAPAAGERPGGRVHVVDGAALQACQRGDIDAEALMEEAARYSF